MQEEDDEEDARGRLGDKRRMAEKGRWRRGGRGGEGGGQQGMVSVTRPVILQQEGERFPAAPVASCSRSEHSTRGRTDRFDVSKY